MRARWSIVVLFLVASRAGADRVDDALALLASPMPELRAQAALVLGTKQKDAARVVGPLIARLGDPQRVVRAAAAVALGRLGDPAGIEVLSEAMGDEDQMVAQAARKAIPKIVTAFVQRRGAFASRRYTFDVRGMRLSPRIEDPEVLPKVKDLALERLLVYKNVDVSDSMSFDDEDGKAADARPVIPLDLAGEVVSIEPNQCTLRLVLALQPGGHVVSRWDSVKATGKTADEAVENAVAAGIRHILVFLGAVSEVKVR